MQNLTDAASALSGSGPAYMYLFLEALANGAMDCVIAAYQKNLKLGK